MTTKKAEGIYIGSVCNANCGFCIDVDRNNRQHKNTIRSSKDIITEIDLLVSEGEVDCIIYEGGDFSVHPDIFDIIAYGNTKGIKQTFQTNGLAMANEVFVKKLRTLGIDTVNISLHSMDDKLYDHIMGTKNGLQRVMQGIDNCRKAGMCININFVITKNNLSQIFPVLLASLRWKVLQITFIMFIPNRDFSEPTNIGFAPDPRIVGKIIAKLCSWLAVLELRAGNNLIDVKFHNIPFCLCRTDRDIYVDTFRRGRASYKGVPAQRFYFKDECAVCKKYERCTGITKFYVDICGSDILTPF